MSNLLLVSATKLEHNSQNLFGYPINIIGIGKVEAATNINRLIAKYNPKVIVNFGSCGGLKTFNPGEIIEVGEVYNDFYAGRIHSYPKIIIGNSKIKCFTTDVFFDKTNNYHDSYINMIQKCDIVDMELYPLAYNCKVNDIKLFSFKWVSDDGNLNKWKDMSDIGFLNFKDFFRDWIKKNNFY